MTLDMNVRRHILQPMPIGFDPLDSGRVINSYTDISDSERQRLIDFFSNRTATILWAAYKQWNLEDQYIKSKCLHTATVIDEAMKTSGISSPRELAKLMNETSQQQGLGFYLAGGIIESGNEEVLRQLFDFIVNKQPFLYIVGEVKKL